MTSEPAPIAPAHMTGAGGYDLDTVCTCERPYVTMAGPCPCRCHAYRHHTRAVHVTPAEWCPACRAIAAQERQP